ncbi:MAG: hypothetical protein RBS96_08930, partial [Dehalococcoidales bacterium]|nr:hypothetical protein [Dehalococcoidales bacterium]
MSASEGSYKNRARSYGNTAYVAMGAIRVRSFVGLTPDSRKTQVKRKTRLEDGHEKGEDNTAYGALSSRM